MRRTCFVSSSIPFASARIDGSEVALDAFRNHCVTSAQAMIASLPLSGRFAKPLKGRFEFVSHLFDFVGQGEGVAALEMHLGMEPIEVGGLIERRHGAGFDEHLHSAPQKEGPG